STPSPPRSTLFPYTTLFRSVNIQNGRHRRLDAVQELAELYRAMPGVEISHDPTTLHAQRRKQRDGAVPHVIMGAPLGLAGAHRRSEEHTSELQSPDHLVCRL